MKRGFHRHGLSAFVQVYLLSDDSAVIELHIGDPHDGGSLLTLRLSDRADEWTDCLRTEVGEAAVRIACRLIDEAMAERGRELAEAEEGGADDED